MEDAKRILLELVAERIQEERRRYNNLLLQAVQKKIEVYNTEDLGRVVGTLNYAYNVALSAKHTASDEYVIKLISLLATSVVLAGEVDGEVRAISDIIELLYDGNSPDEVA